MLLCFAGLPSAQHLISTCSPASRAQHLPSILAPLNASLGAVLHQEWKPLAFLSDNILPWHVSALAAPTAPEGPSSRASTQSKERCWGGQHGNISGMAEPLRHGTDSGDPQNASPVTSLSEQCTLSHHRHTHTHTSSSESHRSSWWGQELMQIPVSELCHFSRAGRQPPCLLNMRRLSAHAKHTPFVFVPCSARRRDFGLITHEGGRFVTSTRGSSARTRDLSSHCPPCPQTVSTDHIPLGQCLCCQQTPQNPPPSGTSQHGVGGEGGQ